MPDIDDALTALAAHRKNSDRLFEFPNVVGTGVGLRAVAGDFTDEVCVQVFVVKKRSRDGLPKAGAIPPYVPGDGGDMIRTDVCESGMFYALQGQDPPHARTVPQRDSVWAPVSRGAQMKSARSSTERFDCS